MAIVMRFGVVFVRLVMWLVVYMLAWLFAQNIYARLVNLFHKIGPKMKPTQILTLVNLKK